MLESNFIAIYRLKMAEKGTKKEFCKLKGLYTGKDIFNAYESNDFWFGKQYQTCEEAEKETKKFEFLTHEV